MQSHIWQPDIVVSPQAWVSQVTCKSLCTQQQPVPVPNPTHTSVYVHLRHNPSASFRVSQLGQPVLQSMSSHLKALHVCSVLTAAVSIQDEDNPTLICTVPSMLLSPYRPRTTPSSLSCHRRTLHTCTSASWTPRLQWRVALRHRTVAQQQARLTARRRT